MPSSRRDFLKVIAGGAAAAGAGACAASHAPAAALSGPAPALGAPAAMSSLVRIGSNENAFGPGPAAIEAIRTGVAEANRYPFRTIPQLAERVASGLGVPASHLILSSGSSELLDAAVSAFTAPDRKLVTASPTFEMPANRATALQRPFVAVPVDASGRLDLDGMLAAADGCGLVYLCNPNNPTATVRGGADVESFIAKVHQRAPDAVILVDEAYHEYVDDPAYHSVVPVAARDPRVIVTRTFSKIHGLAGLRVGFAVAAPGTLSPLRAWVDSMNMNALGVAAAHASAADSAHLESQRVANRAGRAALLAAFRQAGYTAFESQANFVMVHVRRDARSFAAACLSQGVQVARAFPPLTEYARITVGTPQEMTRATRVFLDVLAASAVPAGPPTTRWEVDGIGRTC